MILILPPKLMTPRYRASMGRIFDPGAGKAPGNCGGSLLLAKNRRDFALRDR
jgi:hypothetical protein